MARLPLRSANGRKGPAVAGPFRRSWGEESVSYRRGATDQDTEDERARPGIGIGGGFRSLDVHGVRRRRIVRVCGEGGQTDSDRESQQNENRGRDPDVHGVSFLSRHADVHQVRNSMNEFVRIPE
ncbi:hypothetical protein IFM12275_45670 [Nocardia sputorum]|uniref:Uncharacterized protein n=1 Tax=Nocardia sputorum TaxID=2984338 RepID=A0ABM8D454_9NOCA|nr:hypothetical protein IFM12275_45670 [Nocardia sputorum]BDU02161.1 hypothetical protein IFM12276_51890 [Nocardia sputorum]